LRAVPPGSSSFVHDEIGAAEQMGDTELVEDYQGADPFCRGTQQQAKASAPPASDLGLSATGVQHVAVCLLQRPQNFGANACSEDMGSFTGLQSIDCFNQTGFNASQARQCAAAYEAPQASSSSDDGTGITGAQGESLGHEPVLYFEKWPAWLASIVVLVFTLVLVRVSHSQAKHIAALSADLQAVRKQLQEAQEEEEGEEERENDTLTQERLDTGSHPSESEGVKSWGLNSESGDGGSFLAGVEQGSGKLPLPKQRSPQHPQA